MSVLPNNTHASPDVELYMKAGPTVSGIQTLYDPLVILNSDPNSSAALVIDVGNTRVDYKQVNVSSGTFTDPLSQITQTTTSNTPGILGQPAVEFTVGANNLPELSITSSAVRVSNDLFIVNPGTSNYLDLKKTTGASALIQNVGATNTNRIDFDANGNIRLNSTVQISTVGAGIDILDAQNNIARSKLSPSSLTFWTNGVERGGIINDGTNLRIGQNPTQSAIILNSQDQAVINASTITGGINSLVSTTILFANTVNANLENVGSSFVSTMTANQVNATLLNIANANVSSNITCNTFNSQNVVASTILYYGAINDGNITNAFQTNPSTNTISVIGGMKLQGGSICSGKTYGATVINGGLPNYVDANLQIYKPAQIWVDVNMDPLTTNPNNISVWGSALFYTYYQSAGGGNSNLVYGTHYNTGNGCNIFLSTTQFPSAVNPNILNYLDLIVQNTTGQTQNTVQYQVAWTFMNRYDANEFAT